MKILHTSDWHLGRLLLGERRDTVFTQFLDWLLTTLKAEQCDALLIAGDVFDSTVPGTSAQKLYYSFLARVRQETACRTVVITGGNHDSPMLLNAPRDLLSAFDIHVVGRASADPTNEVVVIRNPDGHPAAVVCAVPFLREGDLCTLSDEETHLDRRQRLIDATANHYRTVVDKALEICPAAQDSVPLIAMGHLFAAGSAAGSTERDLYVGALADVPDTVFPEAVDYLALGHLHRPQIVAKNPSHCYSGSPFALDFSESASPHQVNLVEFTGKTPVVTSITVPAFERLLHVAGTADDIIAAVKEALTDPAPGFLDVEHTGNLTAPELLQTLNDLLKDAPLKLLRFIDRAAEKAASLTKHAVNVEIEELTPEKVFELRLEAAKVDENASERVPLINAYQDLLFSLRDAEQE